MIIIMIIVFTATFAFAQDIVNFSGYGKYDVIFSYIYTNGTKLVLHLSYLIRLDCISNAFDW